MVSARFGPSGYMNLQNRSRMLQVRLGSAIPLSGSATNFEEKKRALSRITTNIFSMVLQMLETLEKQVLVDVVKKVQKGLKGTNGSWKEFLDVYDKKLGSSLSVPNMRSNNDLIAFLNTITNKDHLKFLEKVVQCHLNCGIMEESMEKSEDDETAGPG